MIPDEVLELLDLAYYRQEAGRGFADKESALAHFREVGFREGLDPHPLFDTSYYLGRYVDTQRSHVDPLAHYVLEGAAKGHDPSPYFDSAYYRSQRRIGRSVAVPLVDYLKRARSRRTPSPNPLFDARYYRAANRHLPPGEAPFAHFVRRGLDEGLAGSKVHRAMQDTIGRVAERPLTREAPEPGRVLLLWQGARHAEVLSGIADVLGEDDVRAVAVFLRPPGGGIARSLSPLVLEDLAARCDVLRESALRLLMKSLASSRPLGAITDSPELVEGLDLAGVASCLAVFEEEPLRRSRHWVHAHRVVFGSRGLLESALAVAGVLPARVAVRPAPPQGQARPVGGEHVGAYARSLVEFAKRDFQPDAGPRTSARTEAHATSRKVLVPSSDWSLSGVNSTVEAIGAELRRAGWDVEILFTRSRAFVERSAGTEELMPRLPYRYLTQEERGVEGMWRALIAEIEREAPCVVLTTYDFVANSVVPALSDSVGVVIWLQADEGDYYEQAYRLGRYANAVVCVSDHIRGVLRTLNPTIAERAHVIHNSSVAVNDIASGRDPRADGLYIVYTGRLIQYQKRVLDFVELADELERLDVPFRITLVGDFTVQDPANAVFPKRARRHLQAGRLRVVARQSREQVLRELDENDFFVLLSDFEGLPLSLVEAMARGCVPIVAAMESGIAELVQSGQNGVVVGGRNYGEWGRLLRELWRDAPRVAALSAAARSTVRERFTVEKVAAALDVLFESVMEEVSGGRYRRPPSLAGTQGRPLGHVVPAPSLYGATKIAGLR